VPHLALKASACPRSSAYCIARLFALNSTESNAKGPSRTSCRA
jgi:hypothetical protein